jgi:two-component system LytT family response regulator
MITAIAIDDEPIALEIIKTLVARIPFIDLKACYTNAFDAVALLCNEQIDLIFLDIKMPDISGIDFLQSIASKPMVIFTTAYSEHAVQSFELDAIDYLLKPFSLARLLKACTKANEHHAFRHRNLPNTDSLFIKTGSEQVRVSASEILYAESNGNYVQFVMHDRKLLSRLTMSEAELLLAGGNFIRIHRSYIVALQHISRMDRNTIWLNNTALPVGANYANDVAKSIR